MTTAWLVRAALGRAALGRAALRILVPLLALTIASLVSCGGGGGGQGTPGVVPGPGPGPDPDPLPDPGPDPDPDPGPFTLKVLSGPVPGNAINDITYPLTNNSGTFPTGTARIEN